MDEKKDGVDFSQKEIGYEKKRTICPSCKFQTKTFKKENARICRTCGANKDAPPKQEITEMITPGDKEKISEQIRIQEIAESSRWELLDNLWQTKTDLAAKFIEQQPLYYDRSRIWWFWNHNRRCWEMIDETDILIQIDERLAMRHETTKTATKQELLEAFRRVARQNKPRDPPKNCVQFKNKVVNIDTGEETDPTPQYFFSNPIPWNLGESEDTPEMDKVFTEWLGKDKKHLLYEILAFCLSSEYFLHRIFCFVGSGSNGKSKLMDIAGRFVGKHNTTSSDMKNLTTNRFGTTDVFKKLICFIGETNFNEIKNTDVIKRLCGEDLLRFEMKHKDPFQDKSYAKLLVSTNSLPPTSDKTDGWYRRWMIIHFQSQFSEEKNVLERIPDAEYECLARKCVTILSRLLKERKFSFDGSIIERKQVYEDFSNPLRKFIHESCEYDPNGHYFKYEFRDDFVVFCRERGLREWTDTMIGKRIKEDSEIESMKIGKDVWGNGVFEKKYYWAWTGIKKKVIKGNNNFQVFSTFPSTSTLSYAYRNKVKCQENVGNVESELFSEEFLEKSIIYNIHLPCYRCGHIDSPCGFHPESQNPICFNCWNAEQQEKEKKPCYRCGTTEIKTVMSKDGKLICMVCHEVETGEL